MAQLVTLTVCMVPEEAAVLVSKLDCAGIPAWIPNWNHYAAQPWLGIALGGLPVLVCEPDLDDARALLCPADLSTCETCPRCGGDRVFRPTPLLRALIALVGNISLRQPTPKRLCRACGHRWMEGPPKLVHGVGIAIVVGAALTAATLALVR